MVYLGRPKHPLFAHDTVPNEQLALSHVLVILYGSLQTGCRPELPACDNRNPALQVTLIVSPAATTPLDGLLTEFDLSICVSTLHCMGTHVWFSGGTEAE